MQRLFSRIWQGLKNFFEQLFGLGGTKASGRYRKGRSKAEDAPSGLSDTDYEFLFSQLLEGVAHGWHEGRILKFFQQLEERGKQKDWVAWLERFGARVLASSAPNQQLAARMMRLGELACSFPAIEQIGEASYSIGRQLYSRNVGSVIWEYEGPDLEMPAAPTVSETNEGRKVESVTPEAETSSADSATTETLTIEQLLARLQQDSKLLAQMAQQLGVQTNDPQVIVERLIEQFQTAQQELEGLPAPDTVEGWFNRGLQQANLGDLESAIASWEYALALNPNLPQAWHNRGSALAHLGRLEEALASYNKALELDPSDPQAWNDRAYALFNLRRWEEAIMCWDKVVELQPNSYESWYNRGIALENWGRRESALASYNKALEINPDFELAKFKRDRLQNNRPNA
ncbi:MAG: tetratricopeptide repeat protein [Hydrococcus sp. C42_A2020_068]|nr:tetratricopeptide repeat protein [Hydrococcus sp. C42_A2020_068]